MTGLSVRRRILLHNFIMVLVPVLILALLGGGVFYALRSTGSFRERQLELFWPEEGGGVPVQLGLSRLRAFVDWKWKEHYEVSKIHRHMEGLEKRGIRVAIFKDGAELYATEQGGAEALLAATRRRAPPGG